VNDIAARLRQAEEMVSRGYPVMDFTCQECGKAFKADRTVPEFWLQWEADGRKPVPGLCPECEHLSETDGDVYCCTAGHSFQTTRDPEQVHSDLYPGCIGEVRHE
jgi:hypothetical protein